MKKFLLKVSIFAAFAFVIQVILPIWIDPFNVFHAENIRFQGGDPNKNYVKMKYILANPGKFDSFLFGSSRVGAIHTENITGERCYNMTLSTGLPGWHLLNIKTMFENGIYPKKIYIGVDTVSYTGDYEKQINDPMRCPYEYLRHDIIHFAELYFTGTIVMHSLKTVLHVLPEENTTFSREIFYEYGWEFSYEREIRNYDWNNPQDFSPSKHPLLYYGSPDKQDIDCTLNIIKEIKDICYKHDTELIFFTNPMHRIAYLLSVRNKDYFTFLDGLAEISDFWNFSSLNDITTDNANYFETSHYRANVGDILINVMCSGKSYPELNAQGFGVKVTRENAKDFISMLRRQIEDYEKSQQ